MLQETTANTNLLQVLGGSILGLFGGVGATVVWEGLVRPARNRKHLARLLVAEIRMNLRQVEWMIESRKANPEFLPLNLSLGTSIFDSFSAQVGDLPEELLLELIELYTRFRNLTQVGATLPTLLEEYELSPEASDRKTILESRIISRIDGLYGGLGRCKDNIGTLLPKLVRCARLTTEAPLTE